MTIYRLDQQTASQIAAGEVVENPSSVVKELLENALDAGARRIKVILQKGGLGEISVIDDGSGIPAAEVRLALERHATSKIKSIKDLAKIQTLGFRGEALPSIAAVSRISITTRHTAEDTGSHIYLEGGVEKQFYPSGFPRGTMVTVKDLFFNLPVRRNFLRSISAETARVTKLVEVIALSHPGTSFTLIRDGKLILETAGDGNLLNTILKIFGHHLAPYLLPVAYREGRYLLEGYVSSPALFLKSRSHQMFFANRRHIHNRLCREALEKSFSRFVTAKRYPLAFLFLTLPPEEMDVNVHPAKTEVRFQQDKVIYNIIFKGLLKAFQNREKQPVIQPSKGKEREEEQKGGQDISVPAIDERHNFPLYLHQQLPLDFFPQGGTRHEEKNDCLTIKETQASLMTDGLPAKEEMYILGQVFASFIMVQHGNDLLFIDQHAAHERVLWEETLRHSAGENRYRQKVLALPQEMILLLPENFFTAEKISFLTEVGLELEHFGNNSFIVRTVPFFLKDIITAEILADIFEQAETLSIPDDRAWRDAVLLQLTCKAAVKANKQLSLAEMEALLQQLLKCQDPYFCPHGRPIIAKISKQEMGKMFHRI